MTTQINLPAFPVFSNSIINWLRINITNYTGAAIDSGVLTIFSGEELTTEQLSAINGFLNSLDETEEGLKIAKNIKNCIVNELRDSKIEAGFVFDGHVYDTTLESRLNLTAALSGINSGLILPENFTWRTQDNQNVSMDNDGLKNFAHAMLAWAETVYGVSWYHKGVIASLTTASDVLNYDITGGWPS